HLLGLGLGLLGRSLDLGGGGVDGLLHGFGAVGHGISPEPVAAWAACNCSAASEPHRDRGSYGASANKGQGCFVHCTIMSQTPPDRRARFTNPLTACLPSRNPDDA